MPLPLRRGVVTVLMQSRRFGPLGIESTGLFKSPNLFELWFESPPVPLGHPIPYSLQMDPSHTNLWRLDDVFPVPCPLSPSGSQAEQRPVFDNFFPRVDLSSLQQDGADQLQSLLHERETHGQSEWPYQTKYVPIY